MSRVNVYPHVSSAKSMTRYLAGITGGFQQLAISFRVWLPGERPLKEISFWNRYFGYLLLALKASTSGNIILSERFSFLLLVLKKKSTIVICHDMVALWRKDGSKIHKFWYKLLLRFMSKAQYIVCISESTKRDLLKLNPFIDASKVSTIYNGVEPFWFSEERIDSPKSFSAMAFKERKFFLVVGTDAWNKNFEHIIEALQEMKQKDAYLVKVGAISNTNKERLIGAGVNEAVYHVGEVTDDELKWLYRHAIALIFPSYHEGFGWPALEAMATGCPVIAAQVSSIPEVCGNAAWYIDPLNSRTILNAMVGLLNDENKRKEMKMEGKLQASKFDWKKTASAFVHLLEKPE